jgi:SCY1-like protein 1
MLQPLFFIAESFLDSPAIGREVSPLVGLLFVVKDRGVRGALLTKVPFMVQHLDKNTLNQSVFEPLCSGFSDSSPALRELTLKATLVLVPYLHPPNLEKLSRYLIRLQSDAETSIRTNTVIFVAKLAPHLSEMSQQKLLLPAYIRAFRDSFTPCRSAALQSALKTKELFSMSEIACKVLPAVMPLLLDPMPNVRSEAFQVVDIFIVSLRRESERMATIAQTQAGQQQQQQQHLQPQHQTQAASTSSAPRNAPTPGAVAPAPQSGNYLSGLSSWMSSSTAPTAAAAAPAPPSQAVPMPAAAPPVQQFNTMSMNNNTNFAAPANEPAADDGWGDEDEDEGGWGDDDDDDDNVNVNVNVAPQTVRATPAAAPVPSNAFSADHDDPFAAIGAKPAMGAARRPGTGGKLILPKKTGAIKKLVVAAPATKLAMDSDEVPDGWDDF